MDKYLSNEAKIDIYYAEKIVRLMTFAKYQDESRPLFLSLNILNIYEINTYLIALFMYSYFSNHLPIYFKNYFKLNENIHCHATRSSSNIFIDYRRTDYGKFSLKLEEHKFGTIYQLI